MNGKELLNALDLIEKEKNVDKEIIFEALEAALESACKRNYSNNLKYGSSSASQIFRAKIDRNTGDMHVYVQKEVVEDVFDDLLEVTLEDANKKGILTGTTYKLGDVVEFEFVPKNFGRISAQTAKQVVIQKIKDAERQKMYDEFSAKEREVETAIVQRIDQRGNVIVSLGKTDAIIPPSDQIKGEEYTFNKRIKVYVVSVSLNSKVSQGTQIRVSRTHYELIKRLFELECPEVFDGIVEIKAISREAGSRSKIAVYSNDENVDAVGACVGPNGSRVDVVVSEINGEKIDIVPWSENSAEFIAAALRPASVIAVELYDIEEKLAKVVVADEQLSLAIGKEGQNVRLAARLTGWKIDIKSETQARETNFIDFEKYEQQDDYNEEYDYSDDEIVDENYEDSISANYDESNDDLEENNERSE